MLDRQSKTFIVQFSFISFSKLNYIVCACTCVILYCVCIENNLLNKHRSGSFVHGKKVTSAERINPEQVFEICKVIRFFNYLQDKTGERQLNTVVATVANWQLAYCA